MSDEQRKFLNKIQLEIAEEMDFYIDSELGVAQDDYHFMDVLSRIYNIIADERRKS